MSKSNTVSTAVLIDVVNSVDVLVNLGYLIEKQPYDPDDVLRYIQMADVTLKRMTTPFISNSGFRDAGDTH